MLLKGTLHHYHCEMMYGMLKCVDGLSFTLINGHSQCFELFKNSILLILKKYPCPFKKIICKRKKILRPSYWSAFEWFTQINVKKFVCLNALIMLFFDTTSLCCSKHAIITTSNNDLYIKHFFRNLKNLNKHSGQN